MKNQILTAGVAIALLIGMSSVARVQGAGEQNCPGDRAEQYGGSLDPRQHGYEHAYRDGITAGQQDQGRNARSNYRDADIYNSADLGYRSSYGNRDAYRLEFRDGFERGYEDAYARARGNNNGNNFNGRDSNSRDYNNYRDGNNRGNNNPGNSNTNNHTAPGGTFTVAANRQWTPTGIRVNQGDVLQFSSTGEIHFTGNDVASSAGSLGHRYVPGSPLPAAFAGALIGRIDSGQPFGIGDQTSLTMPASGLLYLGINDDNVTDNTGQFQVVISGR